MTQEELDSISKEFRNFHSANFEVVKVVCDETNNTDESVAKNIVNADVWLKIKPSPENVTLTFNI